MTFNVFAPRTRTPVLPPISDAIQELRDLLEGERWERGCPRVRSQEERRAWEDLAPLWRVYLEVGRDGEAFLRRLEYEPKEGSKTSVNTFFFRVIMLDVIRTSELLPGWFATKYPSISCRQLDSLLFLMDLWRQVFFSDAIAEQEVRYEQLVVNVAFLLLGEQLLAGARKEMFLPEHLETRLKEHLRAAYRRLRLSFGMGTLSRQGIDAVDWAWLRMWVDEAHDVYRQRAHAGMPSAEWYRCLTEVTDRLLGLIAQKGDTK